MSNMTPVYYLQSGQIKFWQKEDATLSATVITPNAIVAKKQSQASISYDPYKKHTVVAVYKGEAEVADLATGKKILLKPTDEGKPRIAVVSYTPISQTQEPKSVPPKKSSSGLNINVLIIVGIIAIVLGYVIVRKKSYLIVLYNRIKQKLKKHE